MIIADTSGLLAFFNAAEPQHAAVAAVVADEPDPLVVSPYVLAELDYLVATRIGVAAELTVLAELGSGAYDLPAFDSAAVRAARGLVARYSDHNIGLADASLVVLADRYGTRTLLTLDRRHFGVVRSLTGKPFDLVP